MLPTNLPTTPGIYKIYFLDPNCFYIGSAINLRRRRHEHLKTLRNGTHRNRYLLRAYTKYGDETFHFEIVEHIECKEDLLVREQYYLDVLKPCYNLNPLAQSALGAKRTPEHRAKLSAAKKGRPAWNKGKPASDEARAKLSAAHKGKPSGMKGKKLPPEQVERLVALHKGKPGWNKGKPCSEETLHRLRTMNIGRPNSHPGNTASRRGKPLSPESRASLLEKNRATWAAKGPEARALSVERRRATMAAKKALKLEQKQLSLWDDPPA